MDPLPENGYIESAVLDGATADSRIVELNHGAQGSHLKIKVKTDGAQISGRVLDQDGAPVVSPLVMIFLASDWKELYRMNPEEINKAVDAKYAVKSIRPGKYRLLAVDTASIASSAGSDPRIRNASSAAWARRHLSAIPCRISPPASSG